MEEKKRINLQRHVSPKVPRRYLIRIGIYSLLVIGLIILIYLMQKKESKSVTSDDPETIDEIRNFTIDTTG